MAAVRQDGCCTEEKNECAPIVERLFVNDDKIQKPGVRLDQFWLFFIPSGASKQMMVGLHAVETKVSMRTVQSVGGKILASPSRQDEPKGIHLDTPPKERQLTGEDVFYVGADGLLRKMADIALHSFIRSFLEAATTLRDGQVGVACERGDISVAVALYNVHDALPERHQNRMLFDLHALDPTGHHGAQLGGWLVRRRPGDEATLA